MEKDPMLEKLDFEKIRQNILGWSHVESPQDLDIHEFYCLTNKLFGLTNKKLAQQSQTASLGLTPAQGTDDGKEETKKCEVNQTTVSKPPVKVIYRTFGTMQVPLLDRNVENNLMMKLGNAGLAPAIYYSDSKIRLEEFIEAREVCDADKSNPDLYIQVASFMAKFHTLFRSDPDIRAVHSKWLLKRVVEDRFIIDYILKLEKFKDRLIEVKTGEFVKKYVTESELAFLSSALKLLSQEPRNDVICHNDIHWGNILWMEKTKKYFVIDYEYANSNPRAYDIANFFNEWIYTYGGDQMPYFTYATERFPKEAFIHQFLMYYCYFTHLNRDASAYRDATTKTYDEFLDMLRARNLYEALDAEASALMKEVYILAMFANYYWILVFILAYNENDYQLGCEAYMDSRIHCYEFFKAKVEQLQSKAAKDLVAAGETTQIRVPPEIHIQQTAAPSQV